MMGCTTHPTTWFLWAAVTATAEGQEGQLLWELHMAPPDCAELPSQAVQLRARTCGRRDPHGWKKVTFVTILTTEGPSKEARLGFPIWQRKGGEEKVAQAKKGKLPLEVWWGVSHDFHWQLHSFVSCSGFYHRALPPLHGDEGLFCKEKRDHGGEFKGTGCHKDLLLSTGHNSKDQGQAGCRDRAAEILAAEELPLTPSWEPLGMQEGWAAP